MEIPFTKVEGLGNDFVLVDLRGREDSSALARTLEGAAQGICDRRLGVGGDGLLLVGDAEQVGAASMTVINADGTRAEMCGNGLRCVALHLGASGGPLSGTIGTGAGPLAYEILERHDRSATIRVQMGPATLRGASVPAAGGGRRFLDVSVGNPHTVHFLADSGEVPAELVRSLGPAIERDPHHLPERTNVEFVRARPGEPLELAVWERGSGATRACGTGAVAAAYAAVRAGLAAADTDLTVRLPGGELVVRIESDPAAGAWMTGPARLAFEGALPVTDG